MKASKLIIMLAEEINDHGDREVIITEKDINLWGIKSVHGGNWLKEVSRSIDIEIEGEINEHD